MLVFLFFSKRINKIYFQKYSLVNTDITTTSVKSQLVSIEVIKEEIDDDNLSEIFQIDLNTKLHEMRNDKVIQMNIDNNKLFQKRKAIKEQLAN